MISSPVPPDLRSLLDSFKQEIFYGLNCHQVGIITAFDMSKQLASVQVAVLRVLPDGRSVPYPLLKDVPVYFPGGGGAYMTFPVKAGDPCLLLFNDRDLDNWFQSAAVVAPNSTRTHSLSDGIALVGIRNKAHPIQAYSEGTAGLWYGDGQVLIDALGRVYVNASGAQIYLDGAGNIAVHALSGKLSLAGGGTPLKAALDSLCDALTAWVNTGGSTPNPATVAAIAAVKATIDSILST